MKSLTDVKLLLHERIEDLRHDFDNDKQIELLQWLKAFSEAQIARLERKKGEVKCI